MRKRKRVAPETPTANKQAKGGHPAIQTTAWHGQMRSNPNHPLVTPPQQLDCRAGLCQHCNFLKDIKFKHDLLFSPPQLESAPCLRDDIDKEDHDEPTIRQDNAAFERICDLESERDQLRADKEGLQTKLTALQAQLDQTSSTTNNIKKEPLVPAPQKVYVVHYQWFECDGFALGHGTRSSLEGIYATLSDANDAAKLVYQKQNPKWKVMKMEKVRREGAFHAYRRHDDPDTASKSTTDKGEVQYTFRLEASGRGVVQVLVKDVL